MIAAGGLLAGVAVDGAVRVLAGPSQDADAPWHGADLPVELAEPSSAVRRGFTDPALRRFAGCADRQGIGAAAAAPRRSSR